MRRGEHLVEADLVEALDSGQLAGATLDVFTKEPLAREHPFWGRAEIFVTPHDACEVTLPAVGRTILAMAEAVRMGGAAAGCGGSGQGVLRGAPFLLVGSGDSSY